jgi:hypothetical protein
MYRELRTLKPPNLRGEQTTDHLTKDNFLFLESTPAHKKNSSNIINLIETPYRNFVEG